jgi:uncharacterized protein YbjQ (UPF0145 family)
MKKAAIVKSLGGFSAVKVEDLIADLVPGAEIFSGKEQSSYRVVVSENVFDDAISKLKKCFGAENVEPYINSVEESARAGMVHNLTAATQNKKEKHFFV